MLGYWLVHTCLMIIGALAMFQIGKKDRRKCNKAAVPSKQQPDKKAKPQSYDEIE